MERVNRILAFLLLIVLSVNFFPVDTHQHHAEELILCKDTESHFDEHSISCELCDFLLQEYLNGSNDFNFNQQARVFNSFIPAIEVGYESSVSIPDYRGPPSQRKV